MNHYSILELDKSHFILNSIFYFNPFIIVPKLVSTKKLNISKISLDLKKRHTWYAVLGVKESATHAEIEEAFYDKLTKTEINLNSQSEKEVDDILDQNMIIMGTGGTGQFNFSLNFLLR